MQNTENQNNNNSNTQITNTTTNNYYQGIEPKTVKKIVLTVIVAVLGFLTAVLESETVMKWLFN